MPADSTATAVPAPMAMPTSAVARAGASFTPSHDHGDLAAALLEAPDRSGFVSREDLRSDLVDPEAARDRVGDRLAVAGDHRHLDARGVEVVDRLLRLRPDLVLDCHDGGHGAIDDDVEDRPSLLVPARRLRIRRQTEALE